MTQFWRTKMSPYHQLHVVVASNWYIGYIIKLKDTLSIAFSFKKALIIQDEED